jgi:four helix bundle protein
MNTSLIMEIDPKSHLNENIFFMKTGNPLLDITFQFSLDIVQFVENLHLNKKFVISHQLLKSGTSIGANCREAQHAESRADFIHKLKIAIKEAEETKYWLLICEHSPQYPNPINLLKMNEQILKLINKIIYTSKQNKNVAM